ncbi:MAG: hypothetical protein PVG11_07885 [Anaerolineae bacterium]
MRRSLWLLLVIVALAVPLGLLLFDFARDVFVVEVLRFAWAIDILFDSVPQLPFWLAFLVLVLVVAAATLALGARRTPTREPPARRPEGQVEALARWIRRASQGDYFQWSLAQRLAGLAWEVLAFRAAAEPAEMRRRLEAGRLDVPPAVADYFGLGDVPRLRSRAGPLARLRRRLPGARRRSPALDPSLERFATYLEEVLEVHHEHPTR